MGNWKGSRRGVSKLEFLTERQIRAFTLMYTNPWEYPVDAISERFTIGHETVSHLARALKLPSRNDIRSFK